LFAGSSTNDLSRSTQFGASFLSIAICIDLRQEFRQRGGLRAMGEHGQVQRVPPEQTLVPVSQVFPFGLQPVRALVLGVGALALGIGTLLSIELGPQQPEVLGFGDLGNRHPARRVQLARARSLRPRHPSHGTPRGTPAPPCMPMPYHHERQPPRATRACMHGIPHEVKETPCMDFFSHMQAWRPPHPHEKKLTTTGTGGQVWVGELGLMHTPLLTENGNIGFQSQPSRFF
jgi:hypothetical protein